jgi:hypothetical protein
MSLTCSFDNMVASLSFTMSDVPPVGVSSDTHEEKGR